MKFSQRGPLAKAQITLAQLERSLADAEAWTDKDNEDLVYIAGLRERIETQRATVQKMRRQNAYQVGRPLSRRDVIALTS